ncbi:STAS-like domain-containing protein [Leptospira sp. GIMC2001]
MCKGNKIIFDFSKVESVSHSYCYELFANLVLKIR